MLPFNIQLACAILCIFVQCSNAVKILPNQDLMRAEQFSGSNTSIPQSAISSSVWTCKTITYEQWQNRYYFYSILGMAGWSAFVLTIICLLARLCCLKQRRASAEDELFQLISSTTHQLVAPPIPKSPPSQISTSYSNATPAVLQPLQPQRDVASAIPKTPSTFSFPTENNVDKTVSEINSGGTSYYPPSSVAFQAQGDRWAPAGSKPNF